MGKSDPAQESAAVLFKRQTAESYDEGQQRIASIMDNLHFLIGVILRRLPSNARLLCVGVGTGTEIVRLAADHPEWRFVGIDPSADMLAVCRARMEEHGLAARVELFHGYLSDLPDREPFDAVLCLLVTQFVKDRPERREMLRALARRLKPEAYLINAELSADLNSREFRDAFEKWQVLNLLAGSSKEQVAGILATWRRHVSILPPPEIEALLRESGFPVPIRFFQSLLIHAWYSRMIPAPQKAS